MLVVAAAAGLLAVVSGCGSGGSGDRVAATKTAASRDYTQRITPADFAALTVGEPIARARHALGGEPGTVETIPSRHKECWFILSTHPRSLSYSICFQRGVLASKGKRH